MSKMNNNKRLYFTFGLMLFLLLGFAGCDFLREIQHPPACQTLQDQSINLASTDPTIARDEPRKCP
jgi:hypothetical protein